MCEREQSHAFGKQEIKNGNMSSPELLDKMAGRTYEPRIPIPILDHGVEIKKITIANGGSKYLFLLGYLSRLDLCVCLFCLFIRMECCRVGSSFILSV